MYHLLNPKKTSYLKTWQILLCTAKHTKEDTGRQSNITCLSIHNTTTQKRQEETIFLGNYIIMAKTDLAGTHVQRHRMRVGQSLLSRTKQRNILSNHEAKHNNGFDSLSQCVGPANNFMIIMNPINCSHLHHKHPTNKRYFSLTPLLHRLDTLTSNKKTGGDRATNKNRFLTKVPCLSSDCQKNLFH